MIIRQEPDEPIDIAADRWQRLRAGKITERELAAEVAADPSGPYTDTVVTPPSAEWPAPPGDVAYAGLAGDVVQAIAPHTEADPVGLLGSTLAIFGALASRGHYIDQGGEQKANIYLCLVGETGAGRKGTAQSAIRKLYTTAWPLWTEHLLPGLESGQALVREAKDRWADGVGNPNILLWESELARLLSAMSRDSSSVSTTLRDAWDGVPIGHAVVARKDSGVQVVHHVGMLAGITDTELVAKLNRVEMANGWGNRILWLSVRRPRVDAFPTPVGELLRPQLVARVKGAIEAAIKGRPHKWSAEARPLWEEFYHSIPPRPGLSGALKMRAESQVPRLALLYGLLDKCGPEIGRDHLAAAIELWGYASRSVDHIFGQDTGDPYADALLAMIGRSGAEMKWDDAKRTMSVDAARMGAAVGTLEKLGMVRLIERSRVGGGRPTRWLRRL